MFWVTLFGLLAILGYTWYARQQVIETKAANTIAKTALSAANKPYVNVSGFSLGRWRTAPGKPPKWRIGPTWTNYGNSPASDVVTHLCDPIIRDDSNTPNFDCHISEKEQNKTVLAPHQSVSITGIFIEDTTLDATMTENKWIYIFGYVTYSDAVDFGEKASPRITWFCRSSPYRGYRVPSSELRRRCVQKRSITVARASRVTPDVHVTFYAINTSNTPTSRLNSQPP
jgi:hypothetical protein